MTDLNQERQLPAAYERVEAIVARYETDGDGDKARTELSAVANSLSPESQAILADICALTIQEGLLDREIASLQREREALQARNAGGFPAERPYYMRARGRAR